MSVDVFSDNHDVIAADGRLADIGSFRGAGAFLDEHLTRDQEGWRDGDYLRFYLGTIWISRRADLTPVYTRIFRRLKAVGADWVYHFPELGIVELTPVDDETDKPGKEYSVSQRAVAELEAQQRRAEVERFRADLREINAGAREDAMDRPQPATVRAYQQVYGRDHVAGRRRESCPSRRHCSRMIDVLSPGPLSLRNVNQPTLRQLIVRERWRASRLPSSVGASRP